MSKFKEFKAKKDENFKNVKYLDLTEYKWNKNINHSKINKIFENLKKPFVIRNYYNSNALNTWTEENIGEKFQNIEFPIEVYTSNNSYYNGNKIDVDKTLTVSKYIDYMKNRNSPPYYYLAEVDLFEKINDSNMPQSILTDTYNENEDNQDHVVESIYMGYNTTSGCHVHIEDNYVLNQIIGKKEIILFDYNENDEYITRRHIFGEAANFIKEDFFELDHSKFKNLYKVILNPGDSLFIPPWWYHTVRGEDFTCSVTKIYTRPNHQYMWEPIFKIHLFLLYYVKFFDLIFENDGLKQNYIVKILILIILILIMYIIFFKKKIN